jgi:hypothetical protein
MSKATKLIRQIMQAQYLPQATMLGLLQQRHDLELVSQ